MPICIRVALFLRYQPTTLAMSDANGIRLLEIYLNIHIYALTQCVIINRIISKS